MITHKDRLFIDREILYHQMKGAVGKYVIGIESHLRPYERERRNANGNRFIEIPSLYIEIRKVLQLRQGNPSKIILKHEILKMIT